MSAVESTMLELGTKAPDFTLPIVTGGILNLNKYSKNSKGFVVAFICNHCPYVKHLNRKLVEVANSYIQQGIGFVAISSNDVENYPADSPEKMIEVVKREEYPFPYVYDETQEVAKEYMAACTPDFFLFDEKNELVYRGQFDESRPGNGKETTGADLKNAIDALLEGRELVASQIPSIGCNIKWKPGNEPDYFG
ncbi:MAG: thioredoxin family protein [Balneolaceae bacterium]|nr:thioredoxin family protein [Balneolaceae bacterium]MBO6547879.1 thioredoxin family protein [Balneolaceae bacterium]MBO6648392.1 thioredoxin family protein [Balneolaceae bacterium]